MGGKDVATVLGRRGDIYFLSARGREYIYTGVGDNHEDPLTTGEITLFSKKN
jgi:hypothetical protein